MKDKRKENLKGIWGFLIKSFNGMAFGLFSTLIVGTIIGQIGNLTNINFFLDLAKVLKSLTGIGIGIGISHSLGLEGLKLISGGVAGGIAGMYKVLNGITVYGVDVGNPLTIYIVVLLVVLVLKFVFVIKTPVDIILIPLLAVTVGFGAYLLLDKPINYITDGISEFVKIGVNAQPFFMGIFLAVVMGILLTSPLSSAAIAIVAGVGGIAGGAAVVGCSVQMLGFAVMSRKDNNIGTVISVGIGTSMLQFKNIMKKPIIWLPTIIVSAILGPFSTLLFKMETTQIGAGMGTSGLVGQFQTFEAMGPGLNTWLAIIILQILAPIILVYIFDIVFRKAGLIKEGDLKV